jgi:hypothetical protein
MFLTVGDFLVDYFWWEMVSCKAGSVGIWNLERSRKTDGKLRKYKRLEKLIGCDEEEICIEKEFCEIF